jgi:hypothetical protein
MTQAHWGGAALRLFSFMIPIDVFRPSGTRFYLLPLTQDLRPGLSYAAPPGLG